MLAVGERLNWHCDWHPHDNELNFSWDLRLLIPSLDSYRPQMAQYGILWDDSINLLWPSKTLGAWDKAEARRVALRLMCEVVQYRWTLLFGRNVCDAFGVPFKIGQTFDMQWVPLPHPSGRSRLWNDPGTVEVIKRTMEQLA